MSERRPGRPKGAKNKRTRDLVGYILSQVTPPILTLARMGDVPVEELAARLDCSLLEAWAEKRQCLIAVAPYIHQKQAIAVDVTNTKTVILNLHEGLPVQSVLDADATIIDVVENQALSEDE